MGPKISIVVPCYNQGVYLPEALDSILQQSYANWECLIVNDGSTDNTEETALDYQKKDQRIKYLYQENAGLCAARNAGVKNTSGQYILPLDADDKVGPEYLSEAVKYFTDYPETTLVYARAELFGIKSGEWRLKPYNYTGLLKSNLIYCSAIFKREDFNNPDGYDEQLKKGYEDWDLYLRLLKPDSVVHQLQECHFFYRIKQDSMLTAINEVDQNELNYFIFNKYQHLYRANFENPISLLRKLDLYESMYKNSADYGLGNRLLNPIRFLVKTIKSIF